MYRKAILDEKLTVVTGRYVEGSDLVSCASIHFDDRRTRYHYRPSQGLTEHGFRSASNDS